MSKLHYFPRAAMVALGVLFLHVSQAAPIAEVLDRGAMKAEFASQKVMLGLTRAGRRIVAVGERGLIVLSDDDGKSWRQAKVPVSITLTAAVFPGPGFKQGWAIGHAGIVLHTDDGGETWRKQLDGNRLIRILAERAATQPGGPQAALASQFAADGPDKPFLDLQFNQDGSGFIVGAYGLILRTGDGGNTWQSLMDRIDNPKGLHIYAARSNGGTIYIAGEQGLLARSDDAGKTFTRLASPYRGSYFTLDLLPSGELILGGLKGNVFRSFDRGATFQRIAGFTPVSLSASTVMKDGRIVFANQEGHLFVAGDPGGDAQLMRQDRPAAPLSAVVQAADGSLIVAGIRGITRAPFTVSSGVAK